jgi:hypothetical protein
VETVTRQALRCTPTDFVLHAEVDGYESGERTYSDTWSITIPRDHL